MRLYHVTLRKNQCSIGACGIDPRFSKGARKECWFVTPGLLAWAVLHVQQKFKAKLGEITAYEVLIPAKKLTRRRKGIYTCAEVVRPLFIVDALSGEGVASSYPAGESEGMLNMG